MKTTTSILLITLCAFFSFIAGAQAADNCPGIGSPEATANNYKLFAAYQTGFGGYEAPCELKCFGNENCQNNCQAKAGLRLLEAKVQELTAQNNSIQCPSYTVGCLEQCEKQGVSCAAICGGENPIADKMPASESAQKL